MILKKLRNLRSQPLVTNSLYLLLASGVVAAFGFVFWALAARMFPDEEVGIAATLLSLSNLIALLGLAGFDTTFVRFLPKSLQKEDYINTGLITASIVSAILSVVFLCLFPVLAPQLSFVSHSFLFAASFVIFNVFTTLNILTNSVFIAYRSPFYIFIINGLFSLVKVVLPLLFIGGGPMAIFVAAGLAQVVGALLSFWVMKTKLRHTFGLKVHTAILRLSAKYSLAVYISNVLNLLPPTLLPLIITQQIGAQYTAYYYMAFTIATLVYTIAYSAMQSAFAESSHNEEMLKQHLKKATKLLVILLLPSIIVLMLGAPFILMIFSKTYAENGTTILQLFAISGVFVAFYSAMGLVFKIKHALASLFVMNTGYALIVGGVSYMFIRDFHLIAIGVAWLIGNGGAILIGGIFYKLSRGR